MADICDLHGHFLPGIDDGCKVPEESLQVLRESYSRGIRHMAATPHYYPEKSVSAFLERRNDAWQRLQPMMDENMPHVFLGAEVAYYPGICNCPELDSLCLGNSRYLLLEMPFYRWERSVLRDVQSLCTVKGLTPIIAHIERYLDIEPKQAVQELLNMDVLVQMNAENLLGRFDGRSGRKLLKSGVIQFLGSDCHNTTTRPPNLADGISVLEKHRMWDILEDLAENSRILLEEI